MTRFLLALVLIAVAGPGFAQTTRNQANAAGSAGAAAHMRSLGYGNIHDMQRAPDGSWVGKATRNGVPSTVTVQPQGTVIQR
ncbi:MAG: hypothetical protein NTV97_22375 [Alphaproteobacteria bacterium]|nr:hypothetical protein [Alphaproteobacteria bacterium]